ncbi:MAG TPA: sulfite exporter TauE/SafE family protein [bacterium]|nr:sulfite exporter TauE/SafE family protein [bacterium]HOL49880.1 sulfite exporter TauE/SafE family protein [bacterium]HPO51950.1 sulfite exporter TauE/SafE family protein [bacterium]
MFDYNLSIWGWCLLSLAGIFIGVSKTGIPGLGMLSVAMAALVIPARLSTGVILPMLILGDVFAVAYYRRHARWRYLIKLIPYAAAGIILGYLALGKMTDQQLRPMIGFIVLLLLWLNEADILNRFNIPERWWFAAAIGLSAGFTTMIANAAGSIMIIYLLAMRLPKQEFIGTAAWYFFLLNWFKVPFSASLGLINPDSLLLNLKVSPAIIVGAISGIYLVKIIPQKMFENIIKILTVIAAAKLIIG